MGTKAEARLTKSEQTRTRLMDSASKLFREKGFDGTSLKDLAEVANVSPSALYWHFETKSDLLHHVIERTLLRFEEGAEEALVAAGASFRDQIVSFVKFYVEVQLRETTDVNAYTYVYATEHALDHLTDEQRGILRSVERRVYERIRTIIEDGTRSGEFSPVAPASTTMFAIKGMCEQVQTWYRREGPSSVQEIAEQYGRMALAMLGASSD